ncbi:MAG: tRNA 5-methoxyuridine(34)/uridine 5-oxyacetic acid(34) synthase CmoB [Gammaproteobacteria bacterium]|nr:tRNA 5-methoxyuridine(34)/uridine 5-oxyacetic acid(34) synthase CmoB [Gammaproteobacteria bacterium]
MLNSQKLREQLLETGLTNWVEALQPLIEERLSSRGHGDYERWSAVVEALRDQQGSPDETRELLLQLAPWRKGPFNVAGVNIDAEWRSDMKWARIVDSIAPLAGRTVLDVGCGNGYYALQMRAAGAACVIGVDPTLLFVMQFLAVNHFVQDARVFVLPARLHELPLPARKFDTTFSMGVLYHQRAPIDHLRQLRQTLRADGQLVLETIYVPGEESYASTPRDLYARMRNVWLLPTIAELTTWLRRSGYTDINVIDQSLTSTDEQRATDWMTFESLAEALDPSDASLTVEGWPAPHRVVLTATSP